jgi:L-malate glycosyltransferase
MKILHINSEYATNRLYKNLVEGLNQKQVSQVVYSTIKAKNQYGNNRLNLKNVSFVYSKVLKKYHRPLYFQKIKYLLSDITEKTSLTDITIIHAHKLFSDGGVAYRIFKKYNIPYIVAVRNTDINVFMRYMKHLKPLGSKILASASQIILLTPAYKKLLETNYPHSFRKWSHKIMIIPNGIDQFWFQNSEKCDKKPHYPLRLLFCGNFTKNKNIEILFDVVNYVKNEAIKLRIVGGNGNNEDKVKEMAKNNAQFTELFPWADKNTLLTHYRESDIFIMPSFRETFGLVFVEAMSQGLPVIYSKGQGIDGYFKQGEIGYAVNPNDTDEIINAIRSIKNNYKEISFNCKTNVDFFDWENISKQYFKIYTNICQEI